MKFCAPFAASVLMAGGLLFAGPATAAGDDATETWTMPDVTGKTLAQAQSAIAGLSDDVTFRTVSTDMTGYARPQLSAPSWTVCATAPRPGGTITAKTTVIFGVVRLHSEPC
ncbi:PASTA domain-containing protein [[Mycobacterium] burgundiense]|uniref:PASTA domain-containing protein n=1 Tax=[Mycobacterium] burgundiense TaxID=3064286 RepID=A0ABN9NIQ8_9MYCO|nr:PASTA domain-containing protein [Mycolicibacterium sp. MU0053]CAJ1507065.1 PASTA domain-containing protein [Mycolicibacterium sp. MU0053]